LISVQCSVYLETEMKVALAGARVPEQSTGVLGTQLDVNLLDVVWLAILGRKLDDVIGYVRLAIKYQLLLVTDCIETCHL